MQYDVSFGRIGKAKRAAPGPAFRLAVLGDFSGRANAGILETGANDGLRGVDPGLTRKNIEKIVAVLKERKIITILAGMRMVGNMGLGYTDPFRQLYLDVAKESGIIFMPFFLAGVAADPALNNSDGIHPNRRGYEIIVDNLFPFVLQAIELEKK